MENKFASFAYEEERSTYTEGESRSKRSSILKPPKARAPLQEVNLGGSADDDETGDFDTLRKRRVSFAGVNSVKEFCSNAESAQVCHIQSYEETFSTSSDNSHNSSVAKSKLGTPNNISATEDKNFADDPMDLTDSIMDNNSSGPVSSAQVVRVEPVLMANDLTEGEHFMRNPQGQAWNARKSALEHEEGQSWNARNSQGPNRAAGGGNYGSNQVGESFGGIPRPAKPEDLASSHWSCSMEMTEPVLMQKWMSSALPTDTPFPFGRSSSKPESDSGMELTEAVGKLPHFLVDDNLGDACMEMTEVITRGKLPVAFASSNNKPASMESTEAVRKNQTPFNFAQSPFSGMVLNEPVMTHQEPMARHSLFTSVEKGKPIPRVSYSSTPGRSFMQSPGNKSSSDMDMTGVLSLSKASRLINNQDADDMDFTQMIMPTMPLRKKSRLSTEEDDDPFPIGRHLEVDPADKENLKLPPIELSASIPDPVAEQLPLMESLPKNNFGKPAEEDDDTLALNFNNVKRGNSPVDLSFLKEFKDSSPVHDQTVKSQFDLYSSKKPLQYDVPEDHLLLFSLSTTEDVGSKAPAAPEPKQIEQEQDASPESNDIPFADSNKSAAPKGDEFSKREPFTEDFLARSKCNRSDVEPLRGVRKSSSSENDNHLPPMQMSFKDFEIKSDLTTTVMMNASLSTVGLDDSNILKAGFNDLTSLEQVPACVSQLDITAKTPRPSAAGNTTLARSMMTPHAPGLDSTVENSPVRSENSGAGTRKSENVRAYPREEDNTTHTSFSRPFYMPIPDKPDTNKHGQSFPSLDLEPTEVGLKHMEFTEMSSKRQSTGPSAPQKSPLPQNSPASCSMELTEVLNRKSIPSGRPSITPMRVSSKHDCTDMELSVSICTDETLLRKSSPSVRADEPSPERPSSMDETNLAQPATVFNEIPRKISPPAQDSPVSIASEETVCKSNVTNWGVERIENGSGNAMDTEETLAKSKIISDVLPYQFVETAKNVSRVSQPHPKFHVFPGTSAREETIPSELTDNHLINAGLNSTFSFHNFGSKGSAETVLEPARKSGPAFANVVSDFHCDTTQTGENFFAAHRASKIQGSCAPLCSEVQSDDLITGRDPAEKLAADHDQPKSRIRMSRKSNVFGNLENDAVLNVERSKIRPQRDEHQELPFGKVTGHEFNRKSAGFFAEEVELRESRKSVRVIPVFNEESSDVWHPSLPVRDSEQSNANRKSRGFSDHDALRVQRKSEFLEDSSSETLLSSGRPERPIKELEERDFNRKSVGLVDEEVDPRVSRKSVKIIPDSSKDEMSDTLPSNQLSRKALESAEPHRKSVGFLAQEVDTPITGKSTKVTPNLPSQPLKETFDVAVDKTAEIDHKSVGFLNQEVTNHAPRKSIKITPNFSSEESNETLPSSRPAERSLESAIDEREAFNRKSVIQEFDSQEPNKSIRITRDFNAEKPDETLYEPFEPNTECLVGTVTLNRKSVGVPGQEDGHVPRKSVRVIPDVSEGSCDVPQSQAGSIDLRDVDNSRENHLNDEQSMESSVELPKRTPRKSCIGVKMDSSSEIEDDMLPEVSSNDISEEFEFAIKRNKRKSAVGVKTAPDADSDKESQNPEIVDSGIKVSTDYGHQGWSTDDDHKMSSDDHKMSSDDKPDEHLSQGMMNVSLNDDEVDFSDDERMHVSTPCKPRLSSRMKGDDRKRSLKPDNGSTSDDGGVHDLSQDLMNVSLESDTRSPMLKKTCASPQVRLSAKPSSVRKSVAFPTSPLAKKPSSTTLAPQSPPAGMSSSVRKALVPQESPPAAKPSSVRKSVAFPTSPLAKKPSSTTLAPQSPPAGMFSSVRKSLVPPESPPAAKPSSVRKSVAFPTSPLAKKPSSTTLAPQSPPAGMLSSVRKSLVPPESPPAAKLSSVRESLAPQKSVFEQHVLAPSSSTMAIGSTPSTSRTSQYGMTESYNGSRWDLSYEIRVKNRDFMSVNGFTHLNRQIYEVWLFSEVIGLKATFPKCELNEETEIVSVAYTYKDWKLNQCTLHEDVYKFYKNRLLMTLPEEQLNQECRKVKDLFRIARVLNRLNEDLKPLIERMRYLKLRYPCHITSNSLQFLIVDARWMLRFTVEIDLRNGSLGEDSISVINHRGQVKEDIVKLMYRVLSPQKDTFYAFVKELRSNIERIVAR